MCKCQIKKCVCVKYDEDNIQQIQWLGMQEVILQMMETGGSIDTNNVEFLATNAFLFQNGSS